MINTKSVQKESIQNFNQNVDYFRNYFPDVYGKIDEFKLLLQNNKINQRYSLEYLDGNYNLFCIGKQKYLYKKNTQNYDKKVKKQTSVNSSKQTISTVPFEAFNKKYYKQNEVKVDTHLAIKNALQLIHGLALEKEKHLLRIDKFLILGTLLGTHLEVIDKKIKSESYFILEPNIEIFYYSLFVTQYFNFATKRKLVYSIMDTKEILLEKLEDYYHYNLHKNHSIKYHLSTNNYNYLFETISISLGRLEGLSFPYTSYLKVLEKSISHILNKKKILNVNTTALGVKNKSVMIVAPGHSLSKNLVWLKQHANKFLVVCYSQCLHRLLSENIIPDIVTIVDGEEKLYNDFKGIPNSLLKQMILLANVNVNSKILNLFKNKNLFLYEKEFLLKSNISEYLEGFTVGETTYQIFLMLGFKEIYLIGTDMSIDETSGNTHDEMHKFSSKNKVNMNKRLAYTKVDKINQNKEVLKVEGNFRKKVPTTTFYSRLINNYNRITLKYKKNEQEVYNMSDGAKLKDIKPYLNIKRFGKLKLIDKNKLHKKLIKIFNKTSENKFKNNEKQMMLYEINFSIYLERKLEFYILDSNDCKKFDLIVVKIMQEILSVSKDNEYSYIRKKIFLNYFSINCNLIYYILNTSESVPCMELLERLKNELKKLLTEYRSSYEKVLT